jgi:hypothetical protein
LNPDLDELTLEAGMSCLEEDTVMSHTGDQTSNLALSAPEYSWHFIIKSL